MDMGLWLPAHPVQVSTWPQPLTGGKEPREEQKGQVGWHRSRGLGDLSEAGSLFAPLKK